MKRGAIVKCVKKFVSEKKHPYIHFPKMFKEYMVRDVIRRENGEVSYRLFEITNEHIMTSYGPQEPSFCADNFELVRKPMSLDEVDAIIDFCLNRPD